MISRVTSSKKENKEEKYKTRFFHSVNADFCYTFVLYRFSSTFFFIFFFFFISLVRNNNSNRTCLLYVMSIGLLRPLILFVLYVMGFFKSVYLSFFLFRVHCFEFMRCREPLGKLDSGSTNLYLLFLINLKFIEFGKDRTVAVTADF